MIDLNTFQIFADHLSNLKETSIDKRDGTPQYMTLSTRDAVNFDDVKEEYVKQLGVSEIPKSNDALFDDGKGFLVFVEFKNGFMDRPKQFAVPQIAITSWTPRGKNLAHGWSRRIYP